MVRNNEYENSFKIISSKYVNHIILKFQTIKNKNIFLTYNAYKFKLMKYKYMSATIYCLSNMVLLPIPSMYETIHFKGLFRHERK